MAVSPSGSFQKREVRFVLHPDALGKGWSSEDQETSFGSQQQALELRAKGLLRSPPQGIS